MAGSPPRARPRTRAEPAGNATEATSRTALAATSLVVCGTVSVQVGGALAVWLMPRAGAAGIVTLRLVIAALVLLAVCRPRVRGYTRADWGTVVVFGVILGAMNSFIYQAVARIPLGIAVTLEVLGPLTLSVIVSRRMVSVLWAGLAFAGVGLLGLAGGTGTGRATGTGTGGTGRGAGSGGLDAVGVVFALCAALMWALYIIFSARTGRRFPQADGLALAMCVGAVLSLPLGVTEAGHRLVVPGTIGLAAGVAVLSSVFPYSAELLALRHLPAATFAVLMSLEPAIAAIAGFLVLHQALSATDVLAIALVVTASMGAVRTGNGRRARPEHDVPGP